MAIIKNLAGKKRDSKIVSVNFSTTQLDKYSKWAGKSLMEVDEEEEFEKISLGKTNWEGKVINNLVVEFTDGTGIAVPLSYAFAEVVDDDEDQLIYGDFFVANKFNEEQDTKGEYPYTGPTYMSFGKPAGLTFDEMITKAEKEVEAVAKR